MNKNAINFRAQIPYLHRIAVESKKVYERGGSVNGTYVPKYIHLPLELCIHEHPFIKRNCYDCGTEISRDQVIATRELAMSPHCTNCIQGPALDTLVIEYWKCKFKLVRKSAKHKSGIFTINIVQTPFILNAYVETIKTEYELMECKVIWTHKPPQLTNLSQSTLPSLGKHAALIPTEPTRTG